MLTDVRITFWKGIFRDHMKFISMLLRPGQRSMLEEAHELRDEWVDVGMDIESLLIDTLYFKRKVLDTSKQSPSPINAKISKKDFESAITHMIEEGEYCLANLEGDMTMSQHLDFWMNHSEEDVELAADTIINNHSKRKELYDLLDEMKISDPANYSYYINVFDDSARELATLITNRQISSRMDMEMLVHEIRETEYARSLLRI